MAVMQAATAGEPVLRGRKLCKTYGSGDAAVHALRDVDVEVAAGEFVVLLGASGSGKSTLLNILGGLDVPTSGELAFEGRPLTGAGDDALTTYRREHVGFVFQFHNLIPSLTVAENVALVADIARAPMPVDVAGRNGNEAWIRAGLQPGQKVIVYPPPTVSDGRRVQERRR